MELSKKTRKREIEGGIPSENATDPRREMRKYK